MSNAARFIFVALLLPGYSHGTRETLWPCHHSLSFSGIELDSVLLEARLPSDKLDKCRSLISEFLQRKKVTLKEVQSPTGLLNFAWSGFSAAANRSDFGYSFS